MFSQRMTVTTTPDISSKPCWNSTTVWIIHPYFARDLRAINCYHRNKIVNYGSEHWNRGNVGGLQANLRLVLFSSPMLQ